MNTHSDKLHINMDDDREVREKDDPAVRGVDFTTESNIESDQNANETTPQANPEQSYDKTRIKESDSEGMAPTVPLDPAQRKPPELPPEEQNPNSQNPV